MRKKLAAIALSVLALTSCRPKPEMPPPPAKPVESPSKTTAEVERPQPVAPAPIPVAPAPPVASATERYAAALSIYTNQIQELTRLQNNLANARGPNGQRFMQLDKQIEHLKALRRFTLDNPTELSKVDADIQDHELELKTLNSTEDATAADLKTQIAKQTELVELARQNKDALQAEWMNEARANVGQ